MSSTQEKKTVEERQAMLNAAFLAQKARGDQHSQQIVNELVKNLKRNLPDEPKK
jgi:predicted GNAT family N-acyltransferase